MNAILSTSFRLLLLDRPDAVVMPPWSKGLNFSKTGVSFSPPAGTGSWPIASASLTFSLTGVPRGQLKSSGEERSERSEGIAEGKGEEGKGEAG
jgi:hypothetical protein